MWIIYSLACGVVLALIVFFALSIRKSRGANSNYTEFSIDEVPVESLWRKNND